MSHKARVAQSTQQINGRIWLYTPAQGKGEPVPTEKWPCRIIRRLTSPFVPGREAVEVVSATEGRFWTAVVPADRIVEA